MEFALDSKDITVLSDVLHFSDLTPAKFIEECEQSETVTRENCALLQLCLLQQISTALMSGSAELGTAKAVEWLQNVSLAFHQNETFVYSSCGGKAAVKDILKEVVENLKVTSYDEFKVALGMVVVVLGQ